MSASSATMSGMEHADAADTTCFHCAEPLPESPAMRMLEGNPRPCCCDGCAAAAQWIEDADLDAYYRLRERPGARIDGDDSALALWDR